MKQLYTIHIKVCRGNFFFIVSNNIGHILFIKSSGTVGYTNINKRGNEAFTTLMKIVLNYLLVIKEDINLFIKLEGTKKTTMYNIRKRFLKPLIKKKIKIIGFKVINKIAHNGCRKK